MACAAGAPAAPPLSLARSRPSASSRLDEVQPLALREAVQQRRQPIRRGGMRVGQCAHQGLRLGDGADAGADLAEHALEVAAGHRKIGAHLREEQAVEGRVAPPQQHRAEQRQDADQWQQHHREQLVADRRAQEAAWAAGAGGAIGGFAFSGVAPRRRRAGPLGEAPLQRAPRDPQQLRGARLVACDRVEDGHDVLRFSSVCRSIGPSNSRAHRRARPAAAPGTAPRR